MSNSSSHKLPPDLVQLFQQLHDPAGPAVVDLEGKAVGRDVAEDVAAAAAAASSSEAAPAEQTILITRPVTLANGTVHLPCNTALEITCPGVVLQNVTVTGKGINRRGLITIASSQAAAQTQAPHSSTSHSTEPVDYAGTLSMDTSSNDRVPDPSNQPHVKLLGCTVHLQSLHGQSDEPSTCVLVHAGRQVVMDACRLLGSGIIVADSGSSATATDCTAGGSLTIWVRSPEGRQDGVHALHRDWQVMQHWIPGRWCWFSMHSSAVHSSWLQPRGFPGGQRGSSECAAELGAH